MKKKKKKEKSGREGDAPVYMFRSDVRVASVTNLFG